MSLFDQILRRCVREPEHVRVQTDGAAVIITSRMLGCSEFELFGIAYRQWFGKSLNEKAAEAAFKPYVFTGEVPFWVRHFCQRIRDLELRGELDLDEMCTEMRRHSNRQVNTLIA